MVFSFFLFSAFLLGPPGFEVLVGCCLGGILAAVKYKVTNNSNNTASVRSVRDNVDGNC